MAPAPMWAMSHTPRASKQAPDAYSSRWKMAGRTMLTSQSIVFIATHRESRSKWLARVARAVRPLQRQAIKRERVAQRHNPVAQPRPNQRAEAAALLMARLI